MIHEHVDCVVVTAQVSHKGWQRFHNRLAKVRLGGIEIM